MATNKDFDDLYALNIVINYRIDSVDLHHIFVNNLVITSQSHEPLQVRSPGTWGIGAHSTPLHLQGGPLSHSAKAT